MRKGKGQGLGKGYRNIMPMDSHIHSLSAKGQKTRLYARTVTQKFKVYKFDELSKDVQEKVLDKDRQINVEDDFWWDYDTKAVMDAENDGFDVKDFNFDLFRQGSGARINIKGVSGKIVKHIYNTNSPEYRKIKRWFREGLLTIVQEDNSYANHYQHENTFTLDWDLIDVDYTEEDEKLLGEFTKNVEALLKMRSKQLYKELEENYNYLTTDEAIKETYEANDYEFRKDGNLHG